MIWRMVVPLLALATAGACDDRPHQWDAFVYTGDDMLTYEAIRGFKSFDLCQQAAIERLNAKRPDGGGGYECGYKCELQPDGIYLCNETRK